MDVGSISDLAIPSLNLMLSAGKRKGAEAPYSIGNKGMLGGCITFRNLIKHRNPYITSYLLFLARLSFADKYCKFSST